MRFLKSFILYISLTSVAHSQNYTCLLETLKSKHSPATSIAFMGDTLITGHKDRVICMWDFTNREVIKSFSAHNDEVRTIAVHPSKEFFATGGDKNLLVWDKEGTRINSWPGQSTSIWHLEYTTTGEKLISSSFNYNFVLRDSRTGQIDKVFEGHKKSVLSTAISPDSKWIASGSLDKIIYLWGFESKEIHFTLKGHSNNIYTLDFSDDSKLLASGSRDKNIKIWSTETGAYLRTMSGHGNGVLKVRFLENPRYLLSCGFDKSLKLWDTEKGDIMFSFEGHEGAVTDFVLYDNQSKIASVSQDGTIKLWEISPNIYVDYYYGHLINQEIQNSSLYKPRRKNESRSDYKKRKERVVRFEEKLYKKYYEQYKIEYLGENEE